jgi:ubiquinone/menaquinone biosynthesis C-methylase UbiE
VSTPAVRPGRLEAAGSRATVVGALALLAAGLAALVLVVRGSAGRGRFGANLRRYSAPSAWAYDRVLAPLLGGLYRLIADDAAAVVAATCPTGSVLEIGGGPGHGAVLLARRASDVRITGADIDPAMVARAADRVAREGLEDRVRVEVADVARLPHPDSAFDLVLSSFSMHHWEDPAKAFAEIHRVLRPGGRAIIYDLSRAWTRVERRAPDPAGVAAASPFRGGRPLPLRWPGRVPSCVRLELLRPADGGTEPGFATGSWTPPAAGHPS